MGVWVSSSHIVSAAPSSSGGGGLTLFPCSSMGSLPGETVLHKLLQRESFPRAAVLHKLLQCGSPAGSQVLPANLLQFGLLSPQVHRSCQEPAPVWASHGVIASFGRICLLWCGVLHGWQVDICSSANLHGLQGDSLPSHHRLQGNLCSGIPPPPPSSLTLVSAWWFLSHPTPLSAAGFSAVFFPFLNMSSQRRYHRR